MLLWTFNSICGPLMLEVPVDVVVAEASRLLQVRGGEGGWVERFHVEERPCLTCSMLQPR